MATKTFKIGLSATDKTNMAQDVYERVEALLFDEYDSTKTYNEGDYVVYSDVLYRCKEDNVTGTWNSAKWETATLQDLVDDVNNAVASVTGKANIVDLLNGTLVPEKAKNAENLTPVSDNSGVSQNQAFILEGTGTGNGLSVVDTGSISEVWEKRGKTLVIDQLMSWDNTIEGDYDNNTVHISLENEKIKIVVDGTRTNQVNVSLKSFVKVANHTYWYNYRQSSNLTSFIGYNNGTGVRIGLSVPAGHIMTSPIGKTTSSSGGETAVVLSIGTDLTNGTYYLAPVYINLSIANFTSDELADIEAHPENFFRYYQGDLSYGTRMLNSNGQIVKTTGRNIFDEVMESGNINQNTGENFAYASSMRSKNYIRVIPNRKYHYYCPQTLYVRYYDKDKNYVGYSTATNGAVGTIPFNVVFMRFVIDITTYNNNITISLAYYKDQAETILEDGYNQYYPYEELDNVDTGSEELLAFDVKKPSGLIERNGSEYTFTGSEAWYLSGDTFWYCVLSSITAKDGDDTTIFSNGIKATIVNGTVVRVYLADNPNINTSTNMNSVFANGTKMQYEYKDTAKTTEQGTPFAPTLNINDFGQIEVSTPNGTTFNGVPMGNEIFYPVDYKNSLDTLINYLDGDMTNVAKLTGSGETLQQTDPQTLKAMLDYVNGLHNIEQENAGGALRHQLADKASIDFADTDWLDLGSLTWQRYSTTQTTFAAPASQISSNNNGTNILCALYLGVYKTLDNLGNFEMRFVNGSIFIRNDTYNTPETFKNAMKGMLLAYEKAS